MNARDFLQVADDLASGSLEAEWRSAVSRAYYAAFLVARDVLRRAGFRPPGDTASHAYVSRRLSNSSHPHIIGAGDRLRDMRRARGWADYDLDRPFPERVAVEQLTRAMDIVAALDALAATPGVLASAVTAMRDYERNVLKEFTWQPPP